MHIISSEGRTAAGERENWEVEENFVDLAIKQKRKIISKWDVGKFVFYLFSDFQEQPIKIFLELLRQQAPAYVNQESDPHSMGFQDQT